MIAIIAILAAILFPVFARAREKARQTTCTSNQKQIATAVMMYVQENEERLPGADVWSVIGVTGKSLQCPTAGNKIANAYAFNGSVLDKGLGEIKDPVRTICTVDADIPGGILTAETVDGIAARHTGKPIISYLDSHVVLSSSSIAGFPIVEMTPEDITEDFTELWSDDNGGSGWRFYRNVGGDSVNNAATFIGEKTATLNAADSNYDFSIISASGIGNALKLKAGGPVLNAIYKFETPISGDFALAFDIFIPKDVASNKGRIFGLFDDAGNRMFEIHKDGAGHTGIIFDVRDLGDGGHRAIYIAVNNASGVWQGPLLGNSYVVVERVGSKLKVTATGESNFSFTLPGTKRSDGDGNSVNDTALDGYYRLGGNLGYIAFGCEWGERTIGNIQILK